MRTRKTMILLTIFTCGVAIFWGILYPDKANSGPYLNSAHGNTTYGVDRTSLSTFGYSKGNCAHCHEQHAMIGGSEPAPNSPAGPDYYLLFKDLWVSPPQSNVFCYGCHIVGVGSCELGTASCQSDWQRTNYSYSYWRGGDTTLTCPGSIYESFQFVTDDCVQQSNCGSSIGSSHMLKNIRNFLAGNWGFPSDTNYVNPCSGCHNPHRAQREWAVSRPSQHSVDNNAWALWGDESGEKMSAYTTGYQPPNKVGGGTERDADTQPDYVTLCLDCHQASRDSQCYTSVAAVNWDTSQHGKASAGSWCVPPCPLRAPFSDALRGQYVLCCTDCHEPHGSANKWLLRKAVNGSSGLQITGEQWYNWCSACHDLSNHPVIGPGSPCGSSIGCHVQNGNHSFEF